MKNPVLFCYDGSEGSRRALAAAAEWIAPGDAVALTVWAPASVLLSRAGSFIVAIPNEGEVDDQEAASAARIAQEGADLARERGYNVEARVAETRASVAKTIEEVADDVGAGLIVCGQRGRGAITSALLGSVSHALAEHTKRPVLIAPERAS
jgi:nucleotide-binding universal stress UspA family protein